MDEEETRGIRQKDAENMDRTCEQEKREEILLIIKKSLCFRIQTRKECAENLTFTGHIESKNDVEKQ